MSSPGNPGILSANSVATMRLAPLIKTNAQQARELEMNMLNPLTEEEPKHDNNASSSSPRLIRRTSGTSGQSPSVGTRPALQPQSNSAVQMYTFPTSVPEEPLRSSTPSFAPANAASPPPTLGPAPDLEGPLRSTDALLTSPSELNHSSSVVTVPSQSSSWNPRVTSSTGLLMNDSSPVEPNQSTLTKRRFPFTNQQPKQPKPVPSVHHKRSLADYFRSSSQSRSKTAAQRRRINDRHDGLQQGCCGDLISFRPFRMSFRMTLVLLCILQVVASAGCVWIISFVSSQSLITTLSSQLRQTALKEIAGEIHDAMTKPMAAVNQLSWSYSRYEPSLDTLETLANTTGLYADISMTALNYPAISGLGCITASGLFFSAINISAYLGAGASPQLAEGRTEGYGYAIQDKNDVPVVKYYLPPTARTPPNPNMPIPDFNEMSTLDDVRAAGEWYRVDNFIATERPQYMVGYAGGGQFVWSDTYRLARIASKDDKVAVTPQTVIAASKAMLKSNGDVSFVCFCTVFMNRLSDLLRSLEVAYGKNGLALIVDSYGRLLASSDQSLVDYVLMLNETILDIGIRNDSRLITIYNVLDDKQLITHNQTQKLPTTPTGQFVSGGIFYQRDPAFNAVPLSLNGGSFHLQATVLNSTGLLWTIVVITRDKDFDGDFNYHQLVVGMLTLTVLVIAILVMIFVTHCLNRPLSLVVKYMNAVARMNQRKLQPGDVSEEQTMSRSAEQLKQIYARWKQAVSIEIEDSQSEISRTTASKSSHNALDNTGRLDNSTSLTEEPSPTVVYASKPKRCILSQMVDRSAVCLMREVEDMQITFQSMLHQLTKSTQAVEDANSAKKVFTRYIFHEVRVPLNAVMLGLADLRGSCGKSGNTNVTWSDEQRDVLDIVHEQSQVVGRILNDVLSLHRIEDGALTLQYSCFSIESMVLSTMQSFQPGIAEKQIHYTCQLQTVQSFVFSDVDVADLVSLPQIDVIGDAHRLRQVLANYLSNAIKFTSTQGNVHVSLQILPASSHAAGPRAPSNIPFNGVSVAPLDGSSLNWPNNVPQEAVFRVSVRDTGVGVSEADQQKLFSPYMQVLPALLQSGGGSGLGLSIAKSLIHLHGGEIGYRTPSGEWYDEDFRSEFYFEVPLKMCFRSVSGGTPQSTVHKLDTDITNGSAIVPAIDVPTVGTFSEERQEEENIIKELAALQRSSIAVRQSRNTSNTADSEDSGSNGSSGSGTGSGNNSSSDLTRTGPSLQPPLFSSRPNTASPDSSMRVLAQQRLHAHLLMQNSSNRLAQSPSVQQSQRRLISLAQLPSGRTIGDVSAEQSSADSDRSTNSSKSASVVLSDRTLPAGSSPLAKWSPGVSHNSEFDQHFHDSRDESEDADGHHSSGHTQHSLHLRGVIDTPSRNTSVNGTPSSRSDIYITLNQSSKLGTPLTSHLTTAKRESGGHISQHASVASPLVHFSSRAVVSDQGELAQPQASKSFASTESETIGSSSSIVAAASPSASPEHNSQHIVPVSVPAVPAALERTQTLTTSRVLPINSNTVSPLRVLVAEDSVPNLKLLLLLLRKSNCIAEGVENGQLCVDRFLDWYEKCQSLSSGSPTPPLPFDMILIDGNMPILSGNEACRKLRHMGVKIPIIAVTGNALLEDQRAFIDAGANEVLSKPIQQSELQRLLKAEQRKIAAAAASL